MEKCLKQLTSSRTSPILSEDKYARVLEVLQTPNACKDRNFKHWVLKIKKFQIMDLPGLGVKDALVVPIKDTKRTSSSTSFLRVLSESKVFDVMHNVHVNEFKHAGYKKCREHVSILFYITSISKYEVKIKLLKVIF